jgi:lysophospholipase L1-like esterase
MKKLIYTSLLSLVYFSVNAQQNGVDSSYLNSHYTQRLEFFNKMPNQKNEIVFLGNSITEGGKWQELFPNVKHIVNRGISGDVTYGVLARLDEVLASNPKKIFYLGGINDMKRGTPNETIINNFERFIKITKAKSPKTKIYIESVLPVNPSMLPASYAKLSNEKINDLNKGLMQLCEKYKLQYVNLQPVFADENGIMKKEYTIDGLHLRQASYILWSNHLKQIKAL